MHQNQVTSWGEIKPCMGRPPPTCLATAVFSVCTHCLCCTRVEAQRGQSVSPTSTNPSMMADSLRSAEGEADSNPVTRSQLFQSCARKKDCGEKEGPFDRFLKCSPLHKPLWIQMCIEGYRSRPHHALIKQQPYYLPWRFILLHHLFSCVCTHVQELHVHTLIWALWRP